VRTFFGQGGDLQVRTSALFGAKNSEFFEIYMVCPHGQGVGGRASADILRTREEGVNFSRFCADALYGRPSP